MDASTPDDTNDYLGLIQEGEGSSFWHLFLRAIDHKKDRLAHYNSRTMTALLTFAGLFAATVAALLVDSYKSLSPDPNLQTFTAALNQTNVLLAQLVQSSHIEPTILAQPKSFEPERVNLIYNVLWFVSLVLSLVSALMATMVLDWMSDSINVQKRRTPETLEQIALRKLGEFMGIHSYGLDRLATLVVGLMHLAVILFLVGLSVWLHALNNIVFKSVAVVAGISAFFYLLVSLFPIFDTTCPYRTPLSWLFSTLGNVILAFFSLLVFYIIMVCKSVARWVREKHIFLPDIDPTWVLALLLDYTAVVPVMPAMIFSYFRGEPSDERRRLIDDSLYHEKDRTSISVQQLWYLTSFTKLHLLESPDTVRYLVRRLLDMKRTGIAQYMAHLLEYDGIISRLSAVFRDVGSVPDAIGSIRFLQMLVLADGEDSRPRDEAEAAQREDERWRRMDAMIPLLPPFFEEYDALNATAMSQGDISLLAAASSLRWALIVGLGRIRGRPRTSEGPGYFARSRLEWLLKLLHNFRSLRMLAVSSQDHDNLDDLFERQDDAANEDIRIELASRNAFTLVRGASRCGWQDGWQQADATYLPRGTPHMWDWCRSFKARRNPKSPPSQALHDFLNQDLVKESLSVGPGLAVLNGARLDSRVMSLISDLGNIVDIHAPPAPAPASARAPAPATPSSAPALVPEPTPTPEPTPQASSSREYTVGATVSEACFRDPHDTSQHSDSNSADDRDETKPFISNVVSPGKSRESFQNVPDTPRTTD